MSLTIMTKLHNLKEKCIHIALTLQSFGGIFYVQEELYAKWKLVRKLVHLGKCCASNICLLADCSFPIATL